MANAIIQFRNLKEGYEVDLEAPLEITANEFIVAVNQAYSLGIDTKNPEQMFMQMEYPISLLAGDETLEELGMRNGSIVYFKR